MSVANRCPLPIPPNIILKTAHVLLKLPLFRGNLLVPDTEASEHAWVKGQFACSMQGCPEDASIGFEIELLGFEKTPHWHSMSAQDKISRAERVRQQGNIAFRLGQLRMARQKYLKALKLLDSSFDTDTDEQVCFSPSKQIWQHSLQALRAPICI